MTAPFCGTPRREGSKPAQAASRRLGRLKQISDLVVYLQLVLSQFKLLLEVRIYSALFVHPKSRILRQQPTMGFVLRLLMEWPCRRRAKYGPSHAERHDFVRGWSWLATKWLRMREPETTPCPAACSAKRILPPGQQTAFTVLRQTT